MAFITFAMLTCYLLVQSLPPTGALPFLMAFGYFFGKNASNLMYTCYETINSLFSRKEKIVIIEDLERSPLGIKEQWALLSNLWGYKRKYIITWGYSPDERKEKLRMLEYAMKLDGSVIEIPPIRKSTNN